MRLSHPARNGRTSPDVAALGRHGRPASRLPVAVPSHFGGFEPGVRQAMAS